MVQIKLFPKIFKIFWPIALMMILTNSLSLIDSAMIARYNVLGTSAITIASQLQFLFGPVYFAMMTGVSIYTVQYFARGQTDELKKFSGIALSVLLLLVSINFSLLTIFPSEIIGYYVDSDTEVYNLSIQYLTVFKFSLLLMPFDLFFTYQYRAIGKTKIPLIMSSSQALLNIMFNYFLIYGNGPFNEYGIVGAAIGTVAARFIILTLNVFYAYRIKAPFIGKIRDLFSFDFPLFKKIMINTIPLMIVEFGFGFGNVVYTKIYSLTPIAEFTAFNIAKSISFIINAFVIGTASASGIIIGGVIAHKLVKKDEIKETLNNLFTFMTIFSALILFISVFILPMFIQLFNVDKEYYSLIKQLLLINGIWMAIRVFASSFIAILKSGNDNKFVILVDAGSTFLVGIPLTIIVFLFFSNSIVFLRMVMIVEVSTKVLIGYLRFKKDKWIKQI